LSELPSKPRQALNLAGAVHRRAKQRARREKVNVSPEERILRWEEGCLKCDMLIKRTVEKNGKVRESTRCRKCGCHMQKKTEWASESCPENQWTACDPGKVSVIIISLPSEIYLNRTEEQIRKAANGSVEIIKKLDANNQGRRVLMNEAAKEARGEFIFIVDAHCEMSEGWDEKLKAICGPMDLVIGKLDAVKIEGEQWINKNHNYGRVRLTPELVDKWWGKKNEQETVIESMSITGCGWMMRKSRYWQLQGRNESWSKWGAEGSEMSLKVWLSGGRCLLHNDVKCLHLFNSKASHDTKPEEVDETRRKIQEMFYGGMGPRQIHGVEWLVGKFWPVPGWDKTLGAQAAVGCSKVNKTDHTVTERRILYHGGPGVLNVGEDPVEATKAIVDWRDEVRLEEYDRFENNES